MFIESSSFYSCGWLLVSAYLATVTFLANHFHLRPLTIVECIFISIPTSLYVIYIFTYGLTSMLISNASFASNLVSIAFCIFVYRNISEFIYHLQIETRSRLRTSKSNNDNSTSKLSLNPAGDTFDVTPCYILLVSFLYYSYSFSSNLLQDQDGSLLTPLAQHPDMLYRISMIHSITAGVNSHFDPFTRFEHTLCVSPQNSPVISEFLSAMFYQSGCSLRMSIVIPSVIMASSLPPLIYIFNKKFTGSRTAALLSIVLFYLCDEPFTVSSKLSQHLMAPWSDLWHKHLIPLQEACFIYPLFLIVCLLFYYVYTATPTDLTMPQRKRLLGVTGLFTMFTYPQHSYIAVICLSLVLFISNIKNFFKDFMHFWHWVGFYLPALFPVMLHFVALPFSRFLMRNWEFNWKTIELIWRAEGWYDPFSFWIRHLGLFVFASFFFYTFSLGRRQKLFYSGFLVSFVLGHLYHTQARGIRNNLQLFYCWHVAASGVVALGLSRILKSHIKPVKVVALLIILSFIFNGTYQRLTHQREMAVVYSGTERQLAAKLERLLPWDIPVIADLGAATIVSYMGRKQVYFESKSHPSEFKEWSSDRLLARHMNQQKINSLFEGENFGISLLEKHEIQRAVVNRTSDPGSDKRHFITLLTTLGRATFTDEEIIVFELDLQKIKNAASGKLTIPDQNGEEDSK